MIESRLDADILKISGERPANPSTSLANEPPSTTPLVQEEPPALPFPSIKLKLSHAALETAWSRVEIYGDDGR